MSEVVYLAHEINDNRLLTPEQMLESVLDDIRAGRLEASKLLLLTLDTSDGIYDNGFYASNMSGSEMLTLCERSKHTFNKMMDGE